MIIQNDVYSQNLLSGLLNGEIPCGFTVNGKIYAAAFCEAVRVPEKDGPGYLAYERRALNPEGLAVTVFYRRYTYGAMVWGMEIENTADDASELIENVEFARICSPAKKRHLTEGGYSHLHYCRGSNAQANDWQPLDEDVREGFGVSLAAEHGRGTDQYFPYFNFDLTDGTGFICAIGWSGRWKADFSREDEQATAVFTYPNAAFRLCPGEKVSMPITAVLPWHTDRYTQDVSDSFNHFRRFMLEWILPRQCGKEFDMPVVMRAWGNIDPAGHDLRIDNIQKHQLRAASYGIDAGWYELNGSHTPHPDWHKGVGDWSPAPSIFPNGMGALAEQAKKAGMGFWLWIEFERAVAGSASVIAHPEYYLHDPERQHIRAVNFADPAARKFILNKMCQLIDQTGMNIFRIDFNYDPASSFDAWDAPERRGLTELQYYNGLYAFFEELLAIYPGIVIDNCAGGGRRMDFRMCHYSVPVMCSSDYFCRKNYDPEGIQGHTWGISRFIPVSGDSVGSCSGNTKVVMDTYRVRSSMRSSIGLAAPNWEMSAEEGAWYRKMIADMEQVAPYMRLDHYPLTCYNTSFRDWIAWERCAADGSKGLVMAFRRPDAIEDCRTFSLQGLCPEKQYRLTDIDTGDLGVWTGAQLEEGFTVQIPEKRMARIIFFEIC